MSVVDFPGGGPDAPATDPLRKVRDVFCDLEDVVVQISTATWLLCHVDHLPEGDEQREVEAWVTWLLLDYAAKLREGYNTTHSAICDLRGSLS